MSIHFPKGYLMTDPNQYNPQNPQQAPQYGGYGSYGQNDYGQQAPQYDAPDYGQQAPQYGSPQYSAPQYNNAAGYNQQQPQYGAPQPQGTNGFFALTAPLDQPAYNCTIGEAFIRFWKKYATFKGRASRGEFWWWILCNCIIIAVLDAIIDGDAANGIQRTVNAIWGLATIIPSLALSVRRLHDINKPGTTLVILYVADLIGATVIGISLMGIRFIPAMDGIGKSYLAGLLLFLFGLAIFLATSIIFIVLMARKTDPAGVRFDDPAAGNGYAPVPAAPTPNPAATNAPYGTPYGAPYGAPADQYAASAMPTAPQQNITDDNQ